MEHPRQDLAGVVSSIASKYIRRITIGFEDPVIDKQLRSMIKSKTWEDFDEAIARLAEKTSDNGRRLQFELHVCGDPSAKLFDLVFPRLIESGNFKVAKVSYVWKGSILCYISWSE